MMDWLRNLDHKLFSPPHTFQTILAFVTVRLSLGFDRDSVSAKQAAPEMAENPTKHASMRRDT